METWCAYAVALLMKANFISAPQKFSAYNFGNWVFQGDSVAYFTLKVIFLHTHLGILGKQKWNNLYWGTENQYLMHELRFMMC
jgi:hypothetical protein